MTAPTHQYLTPNYGLYRPRVGETDWGEAVNGNFDIFDTVVFAHKARLDAIEALANARHTELNSALAGHTHSFDSLSGKPTTLLGYGITDASANGHTHSFSSLTSKPTTLATYGITGSDALLLTLIKGDNLRVSVARIGSDGAVLSTMGNRSLSATRTATGSYQITHGKTNLNYLVFVNANSYGITGVVRDTTTFSVGVRDSTMAPMNAEISVMFVEF